MTAGGRQPARAPQEPNPDVLETLRVNMGTGWMEAIRARRTGDHGGISNANTRLKRAVNDAYSHRAIGENQAVELYAEFGLGEF